MKRPPIRSMPRSLISKNILSRRARAHCAMPSRRRGSTTSRASRTRSAPLSGFISTNSWPPTTRWPDSKPLSRRGRHNGNTAERSGHGRHYRTRDCAVRRSILHHRARMENRKTRPQGDRLHADLRAARNHTRSRYAAARHRRRRRSARGHPRRCLLPELYLPHSALDHRTRRVGPYRFRRRHAVPVDLRRDSQSVRYVEDDVSPCLFPLFRRSAELPGRYRGKFLRQRDGGAPARSRRAARAEERPMRDNCRIVLTGMFCEQPPLNLIKSLELSGCYVVDDDLLLVTRWLTGDVAIEGDPLR